MQRTVPFLHGCISLVAFVAALVLIIYMLVAFVAGLFDTALLLAETAFMTSAERQGMFLTINGDVLYNFAVLVVLMKTHAVIVSYIKTHEISVKQVIELTIIALVLEVTFNAPAHSDAWQYSAALLGAALFAIYAFRYHMHNLIARLATETEVNDEPAPLPQKARVAPEVPQEIVESVKPRPVARARKAPVRTAQKKKAKE